MACSTTLSGIARDCSSSKGGIRKVALFPYSYYGRIVTENGADGVALDVNAYAYMVPFNFRKNTSSLTSTLTVDAANGTNFWTSDLAMTFTRQELAKRVAVQSVVTAETGALVQDSNGEWYVLGSDAPVTCTAGTANSGTNATDGNNYQITLQDESNELPFIVADTETNKQALSYINGLFD